MRIWIGLLSVAACVACTPEEPAAVAPADTSGASSDLIFATDEARQDDIGGLLNAARSGQGLPPLRRSAQLDAAARAHAQDMANTGTFSHIGTGGSKPSDRVRAQGYGYCYVAENIAQGQRTAGEAMQSWMDSPGHRRNNLSTKAADYGAARGPGDYWVLVFGRSGC